MESAKFVDSILLSDLRMQAASSRRDDQEEGSLALSAIDDKIQNISKHNKSNNSDNNNTNTSKDVSSASLGNKTSPTPTSKGLNTANENINLKINQVNENKNTDDSIKLEDKQTQKEHQQQQPHRNPFFSIFHHHHNSNHHHHHNHHQNNNSNESMLHPLQGLHSHSRHQSEAILIDYSSESLLQYVREGNFKLVREILLYSKGGNSNIGIGGANAAGSEIKNKSKSNNQNAKFDSNSNYNTISGDASSLYAAAKRVKIDLEIHDDVNYFLNFSNTRISSFFSFLILLIKIKK
jgi:hypothetical protein